MLNRRTVLGAALSAPFCIAPRPGAPSRTETLLLVQEYGPNSLDMQGIGSVAAGERRGAELLRPAAALQAGADPRRRRQHASHGRARAELAESWQVASDGMSCTFKLRDATFHSGRPVTAKDVKWSLDRAVSIGGFATTQMNAGSLEKPEQFVALDDKTFRIDFVRKDKLTLPNLAVTIPFVFDSELAIKNGGGDPWAKEWLKNNVAGSGAFQVESWKPGIETIYVRNDAWTCGKLPKLRRDHRARHRLALDPPRADRARRRRHLLRAAAEGLQGPGRGRQGQGRRRAGPERRLVRCYLNTATGPFTDVRLRQAVAWAMPYEKILQASLFGRGVAMSGGPDDAEASPGRSLSPTAPIRRRRRRWSRRPRPAGSRRRCIFDAGTATVAEPMAVLIKEALAPIGIKVELNEGAGRQLPRRARTRRPTRW